MSFSGICAKAVMERVILFILIEILANLVFLLSVGSIKGYFALHFYLNLVVSPVYLEGSVGIHRFVTSIIAGSTADLQRYLFLL